MSQKILCAGSVQDDYKSFFEKINAMNTKYGPFVCLLIVGEFFYPGEQLDELMENKMKVPLPTYVMAGKNPVPEGIQPESFICDDCFYLGRSGVYKVNDTLNIGYTSEEVGDLSVFQDASVDILLSWYAPAGIRQDSTTVCPENLQESKWLSEVVMMTKPRYHFCGGSNVFWEREPFACSDKFTRFISLGAFQSQQKWHYAMNLTVSSKTPDSFTECPLGRKRVLTHSRSEGQPRGPPETYVCHICQEKGHWIKECPQKRRKKQKVKACWFCLSNPDIEKHLITWIGEEVYVTLAKGPLTESHFLIIPIGHFPSLHHMHRMPTDHPEYAAAQSTLTEINQLKTSLRARFPHQQILFFETFGALADGHHTCIQAIPYPASLDFESALNEAIDKEGLTLLDTDYPTQLSMPYIHFDYGQQKTVTWSSTPNAFGHLQFGRHLMANLLNLVDKKEWKRCIPSHDEEVTLVNALKVVFE